MTEEFELFLLLTLQISAKKGAFGNDTYRTVEFGR